MLYNVNAVRENFKCDFQMTNYNQAKDPNPPKPLLIIIDVCH